MNEFKDKIQHSINLLSNLGYYPYQINGIVNEAAATTNIEELTREQSQELLSTLNDYVDFATKCLQRAK